MGRFSRVGGDKPNKPTPAPTESPAAQEAPEATEAPETSPQMSPTQPAETSSKALPFGEGADIVPLPLADTAAKEAVPNAPKISRWSHRSADKRIGPSKQAAGAKDPPEKSAGIPAMLTAARVALHRHLVDKINLAALEKATSTELVSEITPLVKSYVRDQGLALNASEIERLTLDTADEMLGLGPLEPLLKDDSISDILVNGPNQVFVERGGKLVTSEVHFKDEDHLLRVVHKIVAQVGRRVDESSPIADARLADGSRVNVAIRPIAIDGPLLSIRKFSKKPISLDKLVEFASMTPEMAALLAIAVTGKVSMVISGGTGSGKTTLLNALSSKIPHDERMITIEDAAELQLQQPHVARMETRAPNVEGLGEIRQRELLKNALRMRPDRIIVGEVRGEEAFDMLQAMNTGHEGSMTTIHANNPRDAVARLEQMVGMADVPMSQTSIKRQIASSVHLIVQASRLHDGSRRVTSISEITGTEGDVVQMQEIFHYEIQRTDENGKIVGRHRPNGVRPRFLTPLEGLGLTMPSHVFEPYPDRNDKGEGRR